MKSSCRGASGARCLGFLLLFAAAHGCSETHRPAETEHQAEADAGDGAAGRVAPTDPPPLFGDVPGAGGRKSPPPWPGTPEGKPTPEATGCATIACRNGVIIRLDFPFSFETALHAKFHACRGAHCLGGALSPSTPPPEAGMGVGIKLTDLGTPPWESALLTLWGKGSHDTLSLELEWSPNSVADLVDGDQYMLVMLLKNGEETHYLLTRGVAYRNSAADLPLGACGQSCQFAELDLRGTGIPEWVQDAGVP